MTDMDHMRTDKSRLPGSCAFSVGKLEKYPQTSVGEMGWRSSANSCSRMSFRYMRKRSSPFFSVCFQAPLLQTPHYTRFYEIQNVLWNVPSCFWWWWWWFVFVLFFNFLLCHFRFICCHQWKKWFEGKIWFVGLNFYVSNFRVTV